MIMEAFERHGLDQLVGMEYDYLNEAFIRAFYANLKEDNQGNVTTRVNGQVIKLIPEYIGELINLSDEENVEPPPVEYGQFLTRMGVAIPSRGSAGVGGMDQQYRILHYILTHILKPRKHNLSVIRQGDVKAMNVILNSPSFNWCQYVLLNMVKYRNTSSDYLPYPQLVMRILSDFKFNLRQDVVINEDKTWKMTADTFKGTLGPINAPPRPIPQSRPSTVIPFLDPSKATSKDLAIALNHVMRRQAYLEDMLRKQFSWPDESGNPHGEGSSRQGQGGDDEANEDLHREEEETHDDDDDVDI